MSISELLSLILILPWVNVALNFFYPFPINSRKYINFFLSSIQFLSCLWLVTLPVGTVISLPIIFSVPSLQFFNEPTAGYFSLLISFFGIITNLYCSGYIRCHNILARTGLAEIIQEKSFLGWMSAAIACTTNLAFAGNLFTIFLFYELLTLVTYPLIIQQKSEQAKKAGISYLLSLLLPSMLLFLPAIIVSLLFSGQSDFNFDYPLLTKIENPYLLAILFFTMIIGTSKIALPPLHSWLPKAMVAPSPVSALLHAVAVVKAGLFTVVKIIIYVFGYDQLIKLNQINHWFTDWLTLMTCISIIYASWIALKATDLKKLLAYSTIANLSYCLLAFSFLSTESTNVGLLYALSHSFAKLTLFLIAGSIFTTFGTTKIDKLSGIAKIMPLNMLAFTISALAIIGLAPSMTIFTKYWLIKNSWSNQLSYLIIVSLTFSTLASAKYFLTIIYQAFYGHSQQLTIYSKPAIGMNMAIIISTLATIYLFIASYSYLTNNIFIF